MLTFSRIFGFAVSMLLFPNYLNKSTISFININFSIAEKDMISKTLETDQTHLVQVFPIFRQLLFRH